MDLYLYAFLIYSELAKYSKNVFKLESEDQHKKRMDLLDKREVELCRHKSRTEKREHVSLILQIFKVCYH